jgi:hypothetical protein
MYSFAGATVILEAMKTRQTREGPRFGDLVADFCESYGKRRAKGYLRLAFETHLVTFHKPSGCLISKGKVAA